MVESIQSQSIGSAMAVSVMAQSVPCSSANGAAAAPSAYLIASVPSAATVAQPPSAAATLANKSHAKAANTCKANVYAASWANTQASVQQSASHYSCIARPTMACSIDCATSKPSQIAESTRANASQTAR